MDGAVSKSNSKPQLRFAALKPTAIACVVLILPASYCVFRVEDLH